MNRLTISNIYNLAQEQSTQPNAHQQVHKSPDIILRKIEKKSPCKRFLETLCITSSENPVLRNTKVQFSEFQQKTVPFPERGESLLLFVAFHEE